MRDLKTETLITRMDELGLNFMAANFESFIAEQSRNENTLLERIYDLIETEYIPRNEYNK